MNNWKLKLLAATFLVLGWVGTTLANEGLLSIQIRVEEEKSFSLHLDNLKDKAVEIRLVDKNGYTLITEQVANQQTYAKRFNLMNLPTGLYQIEVESDLSLQIRTLFVKKDGLELAEDGKEIYKPVINQKPDYLDLSLLQLKRANTTLQIRDAYGTVLFSEKVYQFGSIQKRFNLSQLEPGSYTLAVLTSDKWFVEPFEVQ